VAAKEVSLMPDGVVQWVDVGSGEATVLRAGRVYPAAARELESRARHPGAHVHFDIDRDHGVDRAVRVRLRPGARVSHHHRRFADLTGARRPDEKQTTPLAHTQRQLGLSLAAHPLGVGRAWAYAVRAGHLDTALLLYAPDAMLHTDAGTVCGRAHLEAYLETSPLIAIDRDPVVVGENGTVLLHWPDTPDSPAGIEVRCRIAHGRIAEQWIGVPPPEGTEVTVSTAAGPVTMNVVTRGDVTDGARAYAQHRIGTVVEHIEDPVLFVRIKLTRAADPARDRPAIAQVSVDINGRVLRAQVAGHEMREAIDLVQARLRDKFQHRAERRRARRRRPGASLPGEWRHGDPPSHRPDHFDRPADERQVVRHKTYSQDELTPDEAAFDMDQLDFDFYLFRDLASGEDAVLERTEDGSYLLTRLRPRGVDPGPTAIAYAVADAPAPQLGLDEALERITATGERHLFFADVATGQGNVIYHRYDGHYGLITPTMAP
jgi:ribosome-associated translation inhibitor RaiA